MDNRELKELSIYIKKNTELLLYNIQQLYIAKGLTQDKFANLMGFTQGKVSHVETGRNKLSLDFILRASKALNVGLCDICIDKKLSAEQAKLLLRLRKAILTDDPALNYIEKILNEIKID